jgi:hypothetical protein
MQSANPSLGELKRETEQTLACLTRTVEELRSSVSATASDVRQWLSPESIKAEVSDYVRSRGERLVEDLTAAARRNPMQAVAMGAGIAYPLLRHAPATPMPVPGWREAFFAGSKAGQSAIQRASNVASDLSDELGRRGHDLSDQFGASVATARDAATDALGRAGEIMSTGADRLRDSTGSAGSVLKAQTDTVRDSVASLADTARRQPTAFLGIAVLAGFGVVRFLKSSAENGSQSGGSASASHRETNEGYRDAFTN